MFSQDYNKTEALKHLHNKDYNLLDAKFTLLFPAIYKFADKEGLEIEFSDEEKQELLKQY